MSHRKRTYTPRRFRSPGVASPSTEVPRSMRQMPLVGFTKSEISSPNPEMARAINTRLEKLMQRHFPGSFPAWLSFMERNGQGRQKHPHWGSALGTAATLWILGRRHPELVSSPDSVAEPHFQRINQRNLRLLNRLILQQVLGQMNADVAAGRRKH